MSFFLLSTHWLFIIELMIVLIMIIFDIFIYTCIYAHLKLLIYNIVSQE